MIALSPEGRRLKIEYDAAVRESKRDDAGVVVMATPWFILRLYRKWRVILRGGRVIEPAFAITVWFCRVPLTRAKIGAPLYRRSLLFAYGTYRPNWVGGNFHFESWSAP